MDDFINNIKNNTLAIQDIMKFQESVHSSHILDINGGIPVLNIPGTIDQNFYEEIGRDSAEILKIIYKIVNDDFKLNGVKLFKEFGFNKEEMDIFLKTFNDSSNVMSRCDIMLDKKNQTFKMLEFNVDSSVGGMEIAHVNNYMLQQQLYKNYFSSDDYYFVDPLEEFTKMIYKNTESTEINTIAIIDSEEYINGYIWSLYTMKSYLEDKGFSVEIGTQNDLELREGFLFVNNKKIDLVYRVFLNEDIQSDYDSLKPIYEAYKNGTLIFVNGLHTEVYSNKLIFAMMYDKKVQSNLSTEEVNLINKRIPYTGQVQNNTKTYLVTHKDKLVLKPVSGYGGHGIYLGWKCDDLQWKDIIEQLIENEIKYIFQERVYPCEEFQLKVDNNQFITEKYVSTWGFYIFDNKLCGSMYRGQNISNGEIVNAAQGAGMTSVFIKKNNEKK